VLPIQGEITGDMMRVKDLPLDKVVTGLRIKGLRNQALTGVIISVDSHRFSWVKWNDDSEARGGFYGNDCDCEVIEDRIGGGTGRRWIL